MSFFSKSRDFRANIDVLNIDVLKKMFVLDIFMFSMCFLWMKNSRNHNCVKVKIQNNNSRYHSRSVIVRTKQTWLILTSSSRLSLARNDLDAVLFPAHFARGEAFLYFVFS